MENINKRPSLHIATKQLDFIVERHNRLRKSKSIQMLIENEEKSRQDMFKFSEYFNNPQNQLTMEDLINE